MNSSNNSKESSSCLLASDNDELILDIFKFLSSICLLSCSSDCLNSFSLFSELSCRFCNPSCSNCMFSSFDSSPSLSLFRRFFLPSKVECVTAADCICVLHSSNFLLAASTCALSSSIWICLLFRASFSEAVSDSRDLISFNLASKELASPASPAPPLIKPLELIKLPSSVVKL